MKLKILIVPNVFPILIQSFIKSPEVDSEFTIVQPLFPEYVKSLSNSLDISIISFLFLCNVYNSENII